MDPEVKVFNGDKKMARFSIATTDTYKNAEGKRVTETQWHHAVVWGDALTGVVEKYLKKGKEVAVEGKLVHRAYDDKDGSRRYIAEVVVSDILLLGKSDDK